MTAQSEPSAGSPESMIRVFDMMAAGTLIEGLKPVSGRHIDLPVSQLAKLSLELGVDGLRALCLYLTHLSHVPDAEGVPVLGVPEFSARWLESTSTSQTEATGEPRLGRNAAVRGHMAVEQAGFLKALANPGLPGAGARGRTFRAVLNTRLVLVQGGRVTDPTTSGTSLRRGRPARQTSPLPRNPGKRESDIETPIPRKVGNRELGLGSRFPETRGSGTSKASSALARSGLTRDQAGSATSLPRSVGVVENLLSSEDRVGLLARVLIPAAAEDRRRVEARLYPLFNDQLVAERAEPVLRAVGLNGAATSRAGLLTGFLIDILLEQRSAAADLDALGVSGRPVLDTLLLKERLTVGVLVGLGSNISSWGGWLHRVTRNDWTAKPGPLVTKLAPILAALQLPASSPPVSKPAAADLAAPELPSPNDRPTPAAPGDPADSCAALPDRPPKNPQANQPDSTALDDQVIAKHLDAAREALPFLCRPGTRNDTSEGRQRIVRLYLDLPDHKDQPWPHAI